jgi:hypothetical protein
MKITIPIEVDIQEAYDTLTYKEQQEFMINNIADIPNFNLIEEFFERDLLKDIDTEILLNTLEKQGIIGITTKNVLIVNNNKMGNK